MSIIRTEDQQAYDRLLLEEERWEQELDSPAFEHSEAEYWERGARIYEELSKLAPHEGRFQSMRVHCLLQLGRDVKRGGTNRDRARDIFRRITKVDSDHSEANYRLGFLYYYDKQWKHAAAAFDRAMMRKALLSEHRINGGQVIRALCYQARAYQKLSQQSMEKLADRWSEIEHTPQGEMLRPVVQETKEQIYSEKPFRPYIVVIKGEQRLISNDELYRLLETNPECESELDSDAPGRGVILNFALAPREYTVQTAPSRVVSLSGRLADLLHYLLESPGPRTKEQIFWRLFKRPMPPSSTYVKTNLLRLRAQLNSLFEEPAEQVLMTIPEQGYRWNHERYPFNRIIYREDDQYRADPDLL